MIDIRIIRENPELVKASQRARGAAESDVDAVLAADEARRSSLQQFEDTRARNKGALAHGWQGFPRRAPRDPRAREGDVREVKVLEAKADAAAAAFQSDAKTAER